MEGVVLLRFVSILNRQIQGKRCRWVHFFLLRLGRLLKVLRSLLVCDGKCKVGFGSDATAEILVAEVVEDSHSIRHE